MRYGSSRDFAAGNIYVGPSSLDKRAEEIVKDTTLWSELQKELKSKRAVTSSSYHQVIQTFLAHRFVQQTSEANERVRRKRLLAMKQKSEPVLRGTRSTTESSAQSQRRLHNHEDTQQRCTISSSSMRRVSCESKILSHICHELGARVQTGGDGRGHDGNRKIQFHRPQPCTIVTSNPTANCAYQRLAAQEQF